MSSTAGRRYVLLLQGAPGAGTSVERRAAGSLPRPSWFPGACGWPRGRVGSLSGLPLSDVSGASTVVLGALLSLPWVSFPAQPAGHGGDRGKGLQLVESTWQGLAVLPDQWLHTGGFLEKPHDWEHSSWSESCSASCFWRWLSPLVISACVEVVSAARPGGFYAPERESLLCQQTSFGGTSGGSQRGTQLFLGTCSPTCRVQLHLLPRCHPADLWGRRVSPAPHPSSQGLVPLMRRAVG